MASVGLCGGPRTTGHLFSGSRSTRNLTRRRVARPNYRRSEVEEAPTTAIAAPASAPTASETMQPEAPSGSLAPLAAPRPPHVPWADIILFQAFGWDSCKKGSWYDKIRERIPEMKEFGATHVWLPPPSNSVSPEVKAGLGAYSETPV